MQVNSEALNEAQQDRVVASMGECSVCGWEGGDKQWRTGRMIGFNREGFYQLNSKHVLQVERFGGLQRITSTCHALDGPT